MNFFNIGILFSGLVFASSFEDVANFWNKVNLSIVNGTGKRELDLSSSSSNISNSSSSTKKVKIEKSSIKPKKSVKQQKIISFFQPPPPPQLSIFLPTFPPIPLNASQGFIFYHNLQLLPNRFHNGYKIFQSYFSESKFNAHPFIYALLDANLPAMSSILLSIPQNKRMLFLNTGISDQGEEYQPMKMDFLLTSLLAKSDLLKDLESIINFLLDTKLSLSSSFGRLNFRLNFYDYGIFGYRYTPIPRPLPPGIRGSPALAFLLYRVLISSLDVPYCLEKFISLVEEQEISIDHPDFCEMMKEENMLSPSVMALLNGIMESYPGKISQTLFDRIRRTSLKPFELIERTHSPIIMAINAPFNFDDVEKLFIGDDEHITRGAKKYFSLCKKFSLYPGCAISASRTITKSDLHPFHFALLDGNLPVLREIFKKYHIIEYNPIESRRTLGVKMFPIEWMIIWNQSLKTRTIIQVIGFLHKNGYPINRKDDDGNTLLHWAITKKPEIIACLISIGYDLDVKNFELITPRNLSRTNPKAMNILKLIRHL